MKYLNTLAAVGLVICVTGSAYAADSSTTAVPSSASTTAATPAAIPAPAAQAEDFAPAQEAAAAPAAKPTAKKAHHATHHAVAHHAPCKKDKKGHCAKAPRTVEAPLSGEVVRHRKWMGTPNSSNNATKD